MVCMVLVLMMLTKCEDLKATKNQFPYMAHVFSPAGEQSSRDISCTACFIDSRTLITAKSCVIRKDVRIKDIRIVPNSLKVRGSEGNYLTVGEVIPHEEQPIALIRVIEQINVRNIILAHSDQFQESCVTCGYVRECNVSILRFQDGIGKGDYLLRSHTGYFFVYFDYYMLKRSFIGGILECENRLLAVAVGYNMDQSVIMFLTTVLYNNWIMQNSNASIDVKIREYVITESGNGISSNTGRIIIILSSFFYLVAFF